jgi:hypothetical protein
MTATLSHRRTSVEYTLDLGTSDYLIVEEFDPMTATYQIVRIARMLHRDMHENVSFNRPRWRSVAAAFHAQKSLLVERIKKQRSKAAPNGSNLQQTAVQPAAV